MYQCFYFHFHCIFQWYDHDAPESQPFPLKYQDSLQGFSRLMMLRCFRVDRIYRAITEYITRCMSEKYVTPPIISYEAIFEQSTPMSPIVFILSPGSDPASDLMKLAERIEFGHNKIKFLSMGQGQEKVSLNFRHQKRWKSLLQVWQAIGKCRYIWYKISLHFYLTITVVAKFKSGWSQSRTVTILKCLSA